MGKRKWQRVKNKSRRAERRRRTRLVGRRGWSRLAVRRWYLVGSVCVAQAAPTCDASLIRASLRARTTIVDPRESPRNARVWGPRVRRWKKKARRKLASRVVAEETQRGPMVKLFCLGKCLGLVDWMRKGFRRAWRFLENFSWGFLYGRGRNGSLEWVLGLSTSVEPMGDSEWWVWALWDLKGFFRGSEEIREMVLEVMESNGKLGFVKIGWKRFGFFWSFWKGSFSRLGLDVTDLLFSVCN